MDENGPDPSSVLLSSWLESRFVDTPDPSPKRLWIEDYDDFVLPDIVNPSSSASPGEKLPSPLASQNAGVELPRRGSNYQKASVEDYNDFLEPLEHLPRIQQLPELLFEQALRKGNERLRNQSTEKQKNKSVEASRDSEVKGTQVDTQAQDRRVWELRHEFDETPRNSEIRGIDDDYEDSLQDMKRAAGGKGKALALHESSSKQDVKTAGESTSTADEKGLEQGAIKHIYDTKSFITSHAKASKKERQVNFSKSEENVKRRQKILSDLGSMMGAELTEAALPEFQVIPRRLRKTESSKSHEPAKTQLTTNNSMDSALEQEKHKAFIYNWYMLRFDNIHILQSQKPDENDISARCAEDFNLLQLLAQTYENRRWWTILIDDIACPECVNYLRYERQNSEKKKGLAHLKNRIQRACHRGGNACNIMCTHTAPNSSRVTKFFAALGQQNANRMRNLVLETKPGPFDVDVLVSATHMIRRYFRDIDRMEINFHFDSSDRAPDSQNPEETQAQDTQGCRVWADKARLNRDVWTRIICCLERLENELPPYGRLRVRGIRGQTSLELAWSRKCRSWHHGHIEDPSHVPMAQRKRMQVGLAGEGSCGGRVSA